MALWSTLRFICHHPLNRDRRAQSIGRFISWQVASRLAMGPIAVPFVEDSRLLVQPGMTGATGNIYAGLHEFEHMGFTLHLLRPGDCFVDVGANVGSYTVLAGAVVGADCIAIEPIPATFAHLIDNVQLNGIDPSAECLNVGVGSESGTLRFTNGMDCVNHVAGDEETNTIAVPVRTLDEIVGDRAATLIKIDVEGFESAVIAGATDVLGRASLKGLIVELNGSGRRYGLQDEDAHRQMIDAGFQPFAYHPFERKLTRLKSANPESGNTIYVRDEDAVSQRLASARAFQINGKQV